MSRNVTVGLVQMDCELMNKKANLEKMLDYVKEAAEKKVDLLCFPELCSTGYSPELIGKSIWIWLKNRKEKPSSF